MRTLIVEDNHECALTISRMMPESECLLVSSLSDGISALETETFSAVILDLQLSDSPFAQTIEQLPALKSLSGCASFIVTTGHPSLLDPSVQLSADKVLQKPFSTWHLQDALHQCELQATRECLLGRTQKSVCRTVEALTRLLATAACVGLFASCTVNHITVQAKTVSVAIAAPKTSVSIRASTIPAL